MIDSKMRKPRSFVVRLTPAMYHGLALAISESESLREPLEARDIDAEHGRAIRNLYRGWNVIRDAYHKANS